MDVRASAHRHGVIIEDIHHALSLPMAELEDDDDGQTLILGPDRTGRMLELVVIDRDTDDARVIHAMSMRPKFFRYLER